ncbi:DUF1700 domain-containing protein [Chitinimonas lacunae]|uniref:DUF1700 domain-containing protein n=1 Tax=Chitinimonas lacunae TaxID=1963018 RepID=A0ABV8MMS7_9NEIS
MNRDQFIATLRHELNGLPPAELAEIVADYEEYFRDAVAAGRSESEVVQGLGQPRQLARELKAESRIKRWEDRRSPVNFARMFFAVAGLGVINLLLLLPLFVVGCVMVIFFVIALSLLIGGAGVLLSSLPGIDVVGVLPLIEIEGVEVGEGAAGLVLLIIGGAWLWLNLWVSKWMGVGLIHYARLNYRLIRGER